MKRYVRMSALGVLVSVAAILSSATAAAAPFDFHGNATGWEFDNSNQSQFILKYVLDRDPTHNIRSTGTMTIKPGGKSRVKGKESQLPKLNNFIGLPRATSAYLSGPADANYGYIARDKGGQEVGRAWIWAHSDPHGFMDGTRCEASGQIQCSLGELDANQPLQVTITDASP